MFIKKKMLISVLRTLFKDVKVAIFVLKKNTTCYHLVQRSNGHIRSV